MAVKRGRWVIVFVDLPSRTKAQRASARRFANWLRDTGYVPSSAHCWKWYVVSRSVAATEVARITRRAPEKGAVHILDVGAEAQRKMRSIVDGSPTTRPAAAELLTVYY